MKRVDGMPGIVYYGLLGVNSRAAAYAYVLLCVFLGVAALIFAQKSKILYAGVIMFVAACWYLYSIRWVDKHAKWQ